MRSLMVFGQDIKIAHSVFALPFALGMLLLTPPALFSWSALLLIMLCLVTARSYAMGMNRLLDRHFDAANPRTAARMLPAGKLTWQQTLCWSGANASLFVVCCALLNSTAFFLVSLCLLCWAVIH